MILPVTAVNKHTGMEYVFVIEAKYGMYRTYTRKAFRGGMGGGLALKDNVQLLNPAWSAEEASILLKVWSVLRYKFVTLEYDTKSNGFYNWKRMRLTNKGKKVLEGAKQ